MFPSNFNVFRLTTSLYIFAQFYSILYFSQIFLNFIFSAYFLDNKEVKKKFEKQPLKHSPITHIDIFTQIHLF